MDGRDLPMNKAYNVPAYNLATGQYINQHKSQVKCWTRKGGYTTCYNTEYGYQLRKGQPPPKKNKVVVRIKKKKKKKVVIPKPNSMRVSSDNMGCQAKQDAIRKKFNL